MESCPIFCGTRNVICFIYTGCVEVGKRLGIGLNRSKQWMSIISMKKKSRRKFAISEWMLVNILQKLYFWARIFAKVHVFTGFRVILLAILSKLTTAPLVKKNIHLFDHHPVWYNFSFSLSNRHCIVNSLVFPLQLFLDSSVKKFQFGLKPLHNFFAENVWIFDI